MFLTRVRPNINRRPSFNNDFDQLFHHFFHTPTTKVAQKRVATQRPAVNVVEADDHFRIDVAAPGMNKGDFNINVENDTLTIAAKKEENTENKEKYTRREFRYVAFKRSFHLPETIDVDKITATMKNGILSLTLGKKEEAKELPPQRIVLS